MPLICLICPSAKVHTHALSTLLPPLRPLLPYIVSKFALPPFWHQLFPSETTFSSPPPITPPPPHPWSASAFPSTPYICRLFGVGLGDDLRRGSIHGRK